jgi:hypothetical protein
MLAMGRDVETERRLNIERSLIITRDLCQLYLHPPFIPHSRSSSPPSFIADLTNIPSTPKSFYTTFPAFSIITQFLQSNNAFSKITHVQLSSCARSLFPRVCDSVLHLLSNSPFITFSSWMDPAELLLRLDRLRSNTMIIQTPRRPS